MTGESSDGDATEQTTNWESIARTEVAATLHRSHRELYEEIADIADAIAAGASVPTERVESVRVQYLDCDERLADVLRSIDELDPDSPAERIEDERRRIARELRGMSMAARKDAVRQERIEAVLDAEFPPPDL